jgi:hypothetical protein
LRATIAGSMSSSARSSSPPWLVAAVSDIGAERIGPHLVSNATGWQRPCSTPGARHHAPPPWPPRFGSCPLQHLGFRHDAFNRHGFRDRGLLDLCIWHHKAYDVSTWGLRLIHEVDSITAVYIPSTTVASGSVDSAPGTTISAWGKGVDSRTAGDGSSSVAMLMDKRRIHLRSASVWTYTFFTTGFPRFLSIRIARGLQAFDLPLLINFSNPSYD